MSDVGAQLDRAQILLDIGRVALARDLILKDLLQDPTNVRALCLLASCHHADEDYAAMLAVADRAVAADPDHEHGHRIRALALLTLGRGKDAELTALEAIRLAPGLWHGHALLAAALVGQPGFGATWRGFAACRHAIGLAPDEPDAYYLQGVLRQSIGLTRGARRSYQRALRLDPQHGDAMARLGQLHARAGRAVAAARLFRAAAVSQTAVDVPANVDGVLLRVVTWAFPATFLMALVLTVGFAWQAWAVAAGIAAGFLGWMTLTWRRLRGVLPSLVWERLRQNPRFQVRVRVAVVNLLMALGIGAAAVRTMGHGGFAPEPFLWLEAAAVASLMTSVAIIKAADLRERRGLSPDSGRSGGVDAEQERADDPAALTGVAVFMVFRWLRAACVIFIGTLAAGAMAAEAGWGQRAAVGAGGLLAFGGYVWLRRPKRVTWRDRMWQRWVLLTLFIGAGLLAIVGFLVTTVVAPAPMTDVQMLFSVLAFLATGFVVLVQPIWLVVILVRWIRRWADRDSPGDDRRLRRRQEEDSDHAEREEQKQ